MYTPSLNLMMFIACMTPFSDTSPPEKYPRGLINIKLKLKSVLCFKR